jgi:hypothetical protein
VQRDNQTGAEQNAEASNANWQQHGKHHVIAHFVYERAALCSNEKGKKLMENNDPLAAYRLDAVCDKVEKELASRAISLDELLLELRGPVNLDQQLCAEFKNGRCNRPYKCLDDSLRLSNV